LKPDGCLWPYHRLRRPWQEKEKAAVHTNHSFIKQSKTKRSTNDGCFRTEK
jgi:hypothetical protein